MKRKFWNWIRNEDESVPDMERTLFLNGMISDETWYGDEVTPQLFKDELNAGNGNITVWINSPGGDVFAAAQIYNMLRDYKGSVTVKIDGIAASAASVIAMAGDTVCVSPVAMMMIHNPATMAMGETRDMQKAIAMLNEVKESILNAYEFKTGLTRARLSHMMDDETWFNARKAVELGFADKILFDSDEDEKKKNSKEYHYAYEELKMATVKMKSGVSEINAINQYGERCGLHNYIKLANIIEQNIRRGTGELSFALENELNKALVERKNTALKRGSKISTKLLGPMTVMLIVALVILMVPALMSINM